MPGKKKTIHIFGNPMLDFDNLPIRVAPKLRKLFPNINFVVADPNENIEPLNGELTIIDAVEGIDKVMLIDDLRQLKTEKIYSLHDFDLAFNLKLLQKIGKLNKIKIIGVPMEGNEKKILSKLIKLIRCSLELS